MNRFKITYFPLNEQHLDMSVLPTFLEHDSEARLSEIVFTNEKILKILRSLDS